MHLVLRLCSQQSRASSPSRARSLRRSSLETSTGPMLFLFRSAGKCQVLSPFPPPDGNQSSCDLLHSSFRSQHVELRSSVARILNLNSDTQTVDMPPGVRTERNNRSSSAQNKQIRLWPGQIKYAPCSRIYIKLSFAVLQLATRALDTFVVVSRSSSTDCAFFPSFTNPWPPLKSFTTHKQNSRSCDSEAAVQCKSIVHARIHSCCGSRSIAQHVHGIEVRLRVFLAFRTPIFRFRRRRMSDSRAGMKASYLRSQSSLAESRWASGGVELAARMRPLETSAGYRTKDSSGHLRLDITTSKVSSSSEKFPKCHVC